MLFLCYDNKNSPPLPRLAKYKNKTSIQHLKTVLGDCNNGLPLRSDSEEKDTVIISVTDDNNIHVFVGLNYMCKGAPFQTKVETIDDVICMYIEDKCYDGDNNEVDCGYARCYCYYTFDFAFHYEGEINQKYRILLHKGKGLLGVGEESTSVISEGMISRDKKPEGQVDSTDLQGTWKVKTLSIEGVMTDIVSIHEDSSNDAVYQYMSIVIPNSTQGTITGRVQTLPALNSVLK